MNELPELLSPAGNLEKLKTSILYGADAVYLSGQKFGLRVAADNFTESEMIEGIEFAHSRGKKVFITMNSFLYDSDISELDPFLDFLQNHKVDALIVSDLGVISYIKQNFKIPIHLSTQASCTNVEAAKFWKKAGVERIVLGRETSLAEAKKIKEAVDIELEMFIHGSMCMAFSGNCVISNYTQGRDSNRGGCAHSCRFKYKIDYQYEDGQEGEVSNYFMSSKDLNALSLLPEYIDAGIDSLKIEGRMKSYHYAGTVAKVYREALDYIGQQTLNMAKLKYWEQELRKISHRDYTSASLLNKADEQSTYDERENENGQYIIGGVVVDTIDNENIILQVRAGFNDGDNLELMPFSGENVFFNNKKMSDLMNNILKRANPGTLVRLPWVQGAKAYNLVRVVGSKNA